ncbi:hypothetical protein [Celeribacter sp.]|uniref:hypothetical protein n=1 Tax=Celeribacter sp. TaxID=1890673 RepID=UPI003A8EB03D
MNLRDELRAQVGPKNYISDLCGRAADEITRLCAELSAAKAQIPLFPDHMQSVLDKKNEGLAPRVKRITSAMGKFSDSFKKYQWEADVKQVFGEKYVRTVAGDNGRGMGRQYIATTPHHIDGLAEYIAAANPDTVSMLISELAEMKEACGAHHVAAMREAQRADQAEAREAKLQLVVDKVMLADDALENGQSLTGTILLSDAVSAYRDIKASAVMPEKGGK